MDYNPRNLETREYLKLCLKQWKWILKNYDRLLDEGYIHIFMMKDAYFEENDLDNVKCGCYLCELTGCDCGLCPLGGIAWDKQGISPCVDNNRSIYLRISECMGFYKYEEAKDLIKQFVSMIDKECRRW